MIYVLSIRNKDTGERMPEGRIEVAAPTRREADAKVLKMADWLLPDHLEFILVHAFKK